MVLQLRKVVTVLDGCKLLELMIVDTFDKIANIYDIRTNNYNKRRHRGLFMFRQGKSTDVFSIEFCRFI